MKKIKNACKKCGSNNVTRERCLNCGETYPYTDVSISKGSVLIFVVIIGGAILFLSLLNAFFGDSNSDGMILIGAIILAIWILVQRQKKGKL